MIGFRFPYEASRVKRRGLLFAKAGLLALLVIIFQAPGSPSSALPDKDDAPDLIIINARIRTMDPDDPKADAVAIKDGRFVAVGSDRKIRRIASRRTRLIDADGKLIIPGFNDSHSHLLGIGNLFSSVDLRRSRTEGEFRAEIAKLARFLPEGAWVLGGRWNPALADSANPPSKEWIDDVTRDNPVLVYSSDPSIALVNSKALQIAQIGKGTAGLEGGEIVKDDEGVPTGLLKGAAIRMVTGYTRQNSFDERTQFIRTAANYAVSLGITSLQDVSTDDNLDVISALDEKGELKTRIYECGGLKDWKKYADEGVKAATGSPMVRTGCLKSFTDGDPGTVPDFYERIAGADKAGLQVAIHAIGSRAIRYVLSMYERAIKENGPRDRRFRVEHAQSISGADIPRFARSGIIASMQPWLFRGTGPYRSYLDSGARIAFGSDASITDLNPLLGLSVATERRPPKGSEKLTVEEAVYLYTMGSAFAEYQEKVKGSITVGKLADLIILSDDIFDMPTSEIRDVRVLTTIVGGRVVYRAESRD